MIQVISDHWPPFQQPEGMVAITAGAWLASIAFGLALGLAIVTMAKHRITLGIALTFVFLIAVLVYRSFDATHIKSFPAMDGSPAATLLLPMPDCGGSEDYREGGAEAGQVVAASVRSLQELDSCQLPSAISTSVYFVSTCATLASVLALISMALGLIAGERRLGSLLLAIKGLIHRISRP